MFIHQNSFFISQIKHKKTAVEKSTLSAANLFDVNVKLLSFNPLWDQFFVVDPLAVKTVLIRTEVSLLSFYFLDSTSSNLSDIFSCLWLSWDRVIAQINFIYSSVTKMHHIFTHTCHEMYELNHRTSATVAILVNHLLYWLITETEDNCSERLMNDRRKSEMGRRSTERSCGKVYWPLPWKIKHPCQPSLLLSFSPEAKVLCNKCKRKWKLVRGKS